MTWRFKVQGVAIALGTLGLLGLAAAADYVNYSAWWFGF